MIKIFSCSQIRDIDAYTIANEPVAPIDLMERAAEGLLSWICNRYGRSNHFVVFTGPGNNGGDGLALARLLFNSGYTVDVYNIIVSAKYSEDWLKNKQNLPGKIPFTNIGSPEEVGKIPENAILIDALFGSGITRHIEGLSADIIGIINSSSREVVSIDMPSGLRGEDNGGNVEKNIVKAAHTLTFQFPRLSFMFPDNYKFTGEWHLIDIRLHPEAIRNTATNYSLIEKKDISVLLKKRGKFDHKGTFGHGLLIAGSEDKAGAAVLAAKAALRSGIGLITCLLPSKAGAVIQSTLPEAMTISFTEWTKKKETGSADIYSAIGAGPGMGTGDVQTRIVEELLIMKKPAVIDADALNILGKNKKLLSLLHPSVILTPHLKEFERIAGKAANGYERLMLQKNFSDKYSCIVVLKGANSSITFPDGRVIFNSSGNPGMATAGSGDVLTGIILSLLSQGYRPEDATLAGVYLHGLAGDLAAGKLPWESVISSDIIDNIGNAFKDLRADKL